MVGLLVFVALVYAGMLVAITTFLLAVFSQNKRERKVWTIVLVAVLAMFVMYVYTTT